MKHDYSAADLAKLSESELIEIAKQLGFVAPLVNGKLAISKLDFATMITGECEGCKKKDSAHPVKEKYIVNYISTERKKSVISHKSTAKKTSNCKTCNSK